MFAAKKDEPSTYTYKKRKKKIKVGDNLDRGEEGESIEKSEKPLIINE